MTSFCPVLVLPCQKSFFPEKNIVNLRVDNERVKIIWADEGIELYEKYVGDNLERLRDTWCDPSSPASMSVLLSSTYSLLSSAAVLTNKSVNLAAPSRPKPRHHPTIDALQKELLSQHKKVSLLPSSSVEKLQANSEYLKKRKLYQQAIRAEQ